MATSSEASDQNNVKSRRPAESAFKQQRLPAWQPILTAGTVLPTFFVIGIAFIPVGIGLLYFSDEVKECVVDYTFCPKKDSNITCADDIKQKNASQGTCLCEMTINLTEDFKGEVYFYYGLSNYYQNHRRYVKSRDDNQLLGRLDQPLSTDCEPFAYANDSNGQKPIAPCGAIANSLFNDSLSLVSAEGVPVPVFRTGIAWDSDKNIKFRNPKGTLETAFENFTKPSNWAKHIWELDPENKENNGFQNEDLIVWMRTAALPTFRKLYRRVNHNTDGFRRGLNKGLYILNIEYNYPVTDFDGTKSFIISTTSLLGGKNPFLGVAYVVVGTLCLLLGIVLLIIHVKCSKRYYPSPSESFFMDLDARAGTVDRRLETLRAINLAYNKSETAYNEQSEMNIARTNKTTSILDTSKDTAKPDTTPTKTNQQITDQPTNTNQPNQQTKPTNSTIQLEAKPSKKRLYADSANYSPEEKLKLERAAEDLSTTEKGWEDFANTYSRTLFGHDLKEPGKSPSKELQANKNVVQDLPNKGEEPNKETEPKKDDGPKKDEPKKEDEPKKDEPKKD